MDILQRIKDTQLTEKAQAEALLLSFLRATFPLDIQFVELRPLAVSLNSFNGFMTLADGKRLFFKTHTEADNVIGEYYNAAMLAQAGYPVIQPLYSSTEAGKQLLIYEVIEAPSVFDLAWEIETGRSEALPALTGAQHAADAQLLQIYLDTLALQESIQAPVHQLFYHRLAGGRFERFYGALPGKTEADTMALLPDGETPMNEVRRARWQINGSRYDEPLDAMIARAAAAASHAKRANGDRAWRRP
ncbi:MAG: hypothetical protein HXY40_20025 [Chloroflexi bacterium]|nr:hypothetical protein [Chloroflexota bacterium]